MCDTEGIMRVLTIIAPFAFAVLFLGFTLIAGRLH